jgi:hypothetical protein
VVGAEPPPWLIALFFSGSASLKLVRGLDEKRAKRAVMKRWLADVKEAALLLCFALADPQTMAFLEGEGRGLIPAALRRALLDVADRAERAAAPLSISDGTTKRGRARAVVSDTISAKLYCAALIAETWAFFHHKEPEPRSQKAQAAADAYWRATGGEMTGWATDRLNHWRPYFERAKKPVVAAVREEWRHRLSDYYRQAQTGKN